MAFFTDAANLNLPVERLVEVRREACGPPLADPAQTLREMLEQPVGFPALRRALTPDDRIAIAVDEGTPQLARLLTVVFEHLGQAGVGPEAVTLVCPPSPGSQDWVEDLPDEYLDVRVEIHQPGSRKDLSYLATTRQGRRIYLNRTIVDADQAIVLGRRRYDPLVGIGGGETALFPALADEAVRSDLALRLSRDPPGDAPWPLRKEALEVAWLLGAPFLVQVIEGPGDTIQNLVAGPVESTEEGHRFLDARWKVRVERPADLVLAWMEGDARVDFDKLARAYLAASRVCRPGGYLVLLTEAVPTLGPSAALLRQAADPLAGLKVLLEQKPPDLTAGFCWATAAQEHRLILAGGLPEGAVRELFALPLSDPEQLRRLLAQDLSCILLPEAHKTLALVR